MRHKILLTIVCIAGLTSMCTDFPTRFDRIDSDEIRVLDFVFEPAEASPGDTVHVKAIFSGKKFAASDVDWKFSPNYVVDKYGTDTAFDIVPLTPIPEVYDFSENTTSFSFSFIVPSDIFKTHGQILNDWTEYLPDTLLNTLPEEIKNLSKAQLIDLIDLLTQSPQMYTSVVQQFPIPEEELSSMLPILSQFFTVQMRFFADVKNDLIVKSTYTVRYNSRFKKIPLIPIFVNKNPIIDSIGVYKVPGDRDSYNPRECKHEFIRIDSGNGSENNVHIENNYSYFLVAFHNHPDTTKTLDDLLWGGYHLEKTATVWFFQQNDNETKDISPNEFMETDGGDEKSYDDFPGTIPSYYLQTVSKLMPPSATSIKSVKIWCQINDRSFNEIFRPVGSTLIEGAFTFQY